MNPTASVIVCPQCGHPAPLNTRRCEYCEAEFFIPSLGYLSKFDKGGIDKYIQHFKSSLRQNPGNAEAALSLGLCYLDLGLYDLAIKQIDKALEEMPEEADIYYYSAVALFRGRKPRILSLTEVKKIESLLEAACQLNDSQAKYYYLRALIKREYYLKNGMRIVGLGDGDLLAEAKARVVDPADLTKLLQRVPADDSPLLSAIRAVTA